MEELDLSLSQPDKILAFALDLARIQATAASSVKFEYNSEADLKEIAGDSWWHMGQVVLENKFEDRMEELHALLDRHRIDMKYREEFVKVLKEKLKEKGR